MNDKEFIKCQAEKIAELSEQLMQEQRYSTYKSNCCDSLNKEITEAETKIKALEVKLEAEEKHSKMLLFEFSRALEVIRGSGLVFSSDIIEAEFQKGNNDENSQIDKE